MLPAYTKQEDVPEAFREHYLKGADGKWHAEIPTDHPAIKTNATLLADKQTAEAKVTQLESDLEHAKATGIPRGHKPIPNADVEFLEKMKAHGTVQEVEAKLAEHKTLKEEVDKRSREDKLRLVAKDLNYDNADAFVLLQGLPDFEKRTKDSKESWVALIKDDKGVITEKPAAEFIESSPAIAPFLSALKTTDGVRLHGTAGEGGGGTDPFVWASNYAKNYLEQSKPVGDPIAAFNERKSA